MIKRVFLYLVLIGLILVSTIWAQKSKISVESRVDKSRITIGDLITYTVIVRHAPKLNLEEFPVAANLGMFEVRDYKVHDPKRENDQVFQQHDYILSTFETGDFSIPAVTIRYKAAGDTAVKSLQTEEIKIVVESLKPSEAGDIRDIKPPVEIPFNYRRIIVIASIIGIAIAIAILAYLLIKRHKEGKGFLIKKAKPPQPAHVIALESLDALLKKDLLQKGLIKQFYIEISEIIRRYIEGRFDLIALEMTTQQLLQQMRRIELDPNHQEILAEFLELSDLVKFARYLPEEPENQKVIELAYKFVEQTKIVPLEQIESNPTGTESKSVPALSNVLDEPSKTTPQEVA